MGLAQSIARFLAKRRCDVFIAIDEWRPILVKGSLPFGRMSVVDDILRDFYVGDGFIGIDRAANRVFFSSSIPIACHQRLRNVLLLTASR